MNSISNKFIHWLFQTDALKVSSANKPFWYTSGTIGPYYINTHFLYGKEEKANKLLEYINKTKDDMFTFPTELTNIMWENYNSDPVYKGVIDQICTFIETNISLDKIDYISGGERRDWFFSFLAAKLLNKPHLTIFKDLSINQYYNNCTNAVKDLQGKNILHIADLVTEASSYERAWVPAVEQINGNIRWSVVVVDRKQGGKELLSSLGVELYPIVSIDKETFDKALEMDLIDNDQYTMIIEFINDPKGSMEKFLKNNPEFIEDSLSAGGKIAERARLCIEKKNYTCREVL